jgi:hypothetical protein
MPQSPQAMSNAAAISSAPPLDLAGALALNAQMHVAGMELQKQVAELKQERADLLAQQQAARSQRVAYPKGPTPPVFDGSKTGSFEVDSWEREMLNLFAFHGELVFPDDASKVRYAVMFFKHRVLQWYASIDKSTGVDQNWSQFMERLRERYRPMQAAVVARERLRRLKQTGHVSAYADLFQKELTPITDMAPSDQVFNFVSGLSNAAVANKVREKEPKALHEAMDIAVRAELFLAPGGRSNNSGYFRQGGGAPANGSVPMDVNAIQEFDDEEPAEHSPAQSPTGNHTDAVLATMLAKMDEMVQHRVNAMFKKNSSNERVPGLKQNDIEKLRSEGRCFRCKQKGHNKSECPQRPGVGKQSFQ